MTDDALTPDIKFQLVRKIECHKVIGLGGLELEPHESQYMEFHRLSGVILFERNVDSLPQVAELVAAVEERLTSDGLPPLVMADHEGDFVAELRNLIGAPPSAMAIAATGDPALARDVAYETGDAMRKVGVNVVLAPVADLYLDRTSPVTGLRSFGRDPERVAEYIAETIGGFHDAGVLTCVKHFPGHGGTGGDSHEVLPRVKKSLDELGGTDLVPFARAVEAGTDMVMTAHVAFELDDKDTGAVPASFDPRFVRALLRDKMGFQGVIITDALEMEGAREHARAAYGGLAGGFERSILAGSDLLLYASAIPERMSTQGDGEPMIAIEVMQTIIGTLERIVDRERIQRKLEEAAEKHEGVRNLLAILDRSEQRIVALRERAAERRRPPTPRPEGNVINLGDYATVPGIYKTVAERSLVLVRDPASFVPVDTASRCVLLPIEYTPGRSLKSQDLDSFVEALRRTFPAWEVTPPVSGFETDPSGAVMPVLSPRRPTVLDGARYTRESARFYDLREDGVLVPVLSARGVPPATFVDALADLIEQRELPFVIITGWPLYDWVPEGAGALLTLGASPQVGAAAAAVLAGETVARGSIGGIV